MPKIPVFTNIFHKTPNYYLLKKKTPQKYPQNPQALKFLKIARFDLAKSNLANF